MAEISIIGLELAKNVFQAHGAGADGSVVFRRKMSRAQLPNEGMCLVWPLPVFFVQFRKNGGSFDAAAVGEDIASKPSQSV